MKPNELIAALMKKERLGALPLAKRLGDRRLQPPIHRFVRGQVRSPAASTAAPIAKYFDLPLEAMYDEALATKIAEERGIRETPVAAHGSLGPPGQEIPRPLDERRAVLADVLAGLDDDCVAQLLHMCGAMFRPHE